VPSLNSHYFERIDSLMNRSKSWGAPPQEVKDKVTGRGDRISEKKRMLTVGKLPVQRQCSNCNKTGYEGMQVCGRCKTVRYSLVTHMSYVEVSFCYFSGVLLWSNMVRCP